MKAITKTYDPKEELWNVITHGFGLLLSITALVFLVVWASLYMSVWHIVSFSIYGASLVVLYLASTVYHLAKKPKLKKRLNVFDHASIYVLIAGSYTPYMLVTLRGPWGWSIFGVVWGMAIAGIIFKLFFTGRFDKLSTAAYVVMGWIAVVGFYPLIMKLATPGLIMLIVGGVFYTVGAIFYLREKIHFNHVIFHVFVLLGSISHFVSIFFFV
jgi:hemolysin III